MVSVEIHGSTRSEFGKKGSRNDRNSGHVPAVMYGGDEVIHFNVTPAGVRHLIYTPDFKLADLVIDGSTIKLSLNLLNFSLSLISYFILTFYD